MFQCLCHVHSRSSGRPLGCHRSHSFWRKAHIRHHSHQIGRCTWARSRQVGHLVKAISPRVNHLRGVRRRQRGDEPSSRAVVRPKTGLEARESDDRRSETCSAGRTRTYNQWINSPLLYQLSYRGRCRLAGVRVPVGFFLLRACVSVDRAKPPGYGCEPGSGDISSPIDHANGLVRQLGHGRVFPSLTGPMLDLFVPLPPSAGTYDIPEGCADHESGSESHGPDTATTGTARARAIRSSPRTLPASATCRGAGAWPVPWSPIAGCVPGSP
jgi:hypothetical protein